MRTTTEPTRILVDLKEAARLLSLSERKVWQLARDRELKSALIGRSRRFDLADVRAFIERKKREA